MPSFRPHRCHWPPMRIDAGSRSGGARLSWSTISTSAAFAGHASRPHQRIGPVSAVPPSLPSLRRGPRRAERNDGSGGQRFRAMCGVDLILTMRRVCDGSTTSNGCELLGVVSWSAEVGCTVKRERTPRPAAREPGCFVAASGCYSLEVTVRCIPSSRSWTVLGVPLGTIRALYRLRMRLTRNSRMRLTRNSNGAEQ